MLATPTHRLGLALTLSVAWDESDRIRRALWPYEHNPDLTVTLPEEAVITDMETIKKAAETLAERCRQEIARLRGEEPMLAAAE